MSWDPTQPLASSLAVSAFFRTQWTSTQRSLWGKNCILDPNFLIWPSESGAGTAQTVPPVHWTIAGTGATITRCGAGLTDTTDLGLGGFTGKLTFGSALAVLSQSPFASGLPTYFRGKSFSAVWPVQCSTSTAARLRVSDGIGSTTSNYHSGGGSLENLTVTRVLDPAATQLTLALELSTASAYCGGATLVYGEIPPEFAIPAETVRAQMYFPAIGALAVTTKKGVFEPTRPAIVRWVQLRAETAPTGAAVLVQVNSWDGSAFTGMFTSGGRPSIAISANQGGAAPDGTYARRCLDQMIGSTLAAGRLVSYDINQVGSTVTGSDMVVAVHVMQFRDAFEEFR